MKDLTIVTGAGSGMGFEVARIFGKQGPVLMCGRTAEKIEAAANTLKNEGIEAVGIACDVSSRTSVEALAEKAMEIGTIRRIINAAGVSSSSNDAKTVYNINMLGTMNVSEVFYPLIGQGGVLINIASLAAHIIPSPEAFPELMEMAAYPEAVEKALAVSDNAGYAYAISKKFVVEYTKKCCVKFAQKGVRVVSISPGTFETPLLASVEDSKGARDILEKNPAGRMGNPKEIAYLAEFLASDKAQYINGIDIVIDGGYLSAATVRQFI